MNDNDVKNLSGLDELLLDSTLAGIDEDAPPSQIETVLRSLSAAIAGADPIRRAVVRDALIRKLRRSGVSCPVTLANVAFGSEAGHRKSDPSPITPLFPNVEPWPDPVHGGLLLDDMAAVIRRFIVLAPWRNLWVENGR
jgi:hypothetical protein